MQQVRNHLAARFVGEHVYILTWTPDTWREALRQTGRWASSKQFNFSWYDAAILAGAIRLRAEQDLSRRKADGASTD